MLLVLQPNGFNKEWGTVSRGSSVHLSCLGCPNLDNNWSGGLRSPSLIQLDWTFDSLAKCVLLVGCMENTMAETAWACQGLSEWLLAVRSAYRGLKKKGRLCFGKINMFNDHRLNSAYLYGPSNENTQMKYLDGLHSGVMGGQLEMAIQNRSSSSATDFFGGHIHITFTPWALGGCFHISNYISLSLSILTKKR